MNLEIWLKVFEKEEGELIPEEALLEARDRKVPIFILENVTAQSIEYMLGEYDSEYDCAVIGIEEDVLYRTDYVVRAVVYSWINYDIFWLTDQWVPKPGTSLYASIPSATEFEKMKEEREARSLIQ
jgi:hypothetical protein